MKVSQERLAHASQVPPKAEPPRRKPWTSAGTAAYTQPSQPRRRLHPDARLPADGEHAAPPYDPESHETTTDREAYGPELGLDSYSEAAHPGEEGDPTPHRDEHKADGAAYRNSPNTVGPYQAVIVFLLLLMVLVIIGIVYQLFFRPNSEPGKPLVETAGPAPSVEASKEQPTKDLTQEPLIQKPKSTAITDLRPAAAPATEVPALEAPVRNISRSSPLSSITPGGEEIRLPPPAPDSQRDSNQGNEGLERLLQSKVGGIGYWIQVGAFSSLNNANSLKAELYQNQLESVIQESQGERRKLYRVRVGLYTSKIEAERILRQLKNIGNSFSESIIIKTEI